MKTSTIMVGLGALVVIGGIAVLAGGSGGGGSPQGGGGGKFGTVGGLKGGTGPSGGGTPGASMGLTVDKDCGIVITDLGAAQTIDS